MEKFTAKEAKLNMEKSTPNLEQVLKDIEHDSKIGKMSIRLIDIYCPFDGFLKDLMDLGFKVSYDKAPLGEKVTVISWD